MVFVVMEQPVPHPNHAGDSHTFQDGIFAHCMKIAAHGWSNADRFIHEGDI